MRKKLLLMLIIILSIFSLSCCFGATTYYNKLTVSQINEFIGAYNEKFGTNLYTNSTSISSTLGGEWGVGIMKHATKDEYYIIFMRSGTVALSSDVMTFSSKTEFSEFQITSTGISTSNKQYSNFTFKNLMLSDSFVVTQCDKCSYYRYSFTTGQISSKIESLEEDINNISATVTTLSAQVNSIEEEQTGISEQLNTVIDNQQTISGQISTSINNQQTISGQIENLNNDFNEFSSSDTSNLNNSSSNILTNNNFDIEDPTQELISSITTGVQNVLLTEKEETIELEIMGQEFEIKSDFFKLPDGALKNLFMVYWCYIVSKQIIWDIRWQINKFKAGKIEDIGNEDISADMV